MSDKRLWIINHYAVPPTFPGGTRHYDLARALQRLGWDVTIFACSFVHKTREHSKSGGRGWWSHELLDGVRFVWVKAPSYSDNNWRRIVNMLAFSWRVSRFANPRIATFVPRPSVIIGSSVHLFAVLSAWRMSRRLRCGFAMEVRDLWPQTLIDVGKMSPRHPLVLLLSTLERFLYRRAGRIVTLLPGTSEFITTRGGRPDHIVWIPNGVDLSSVTAPHALPSRDPFTVMYVGAHGRANCLDTLLDVAESLRGGSREVRFVFVGDGPMKAAHVASAAKRGLENVEFRPAVPKDRVFHTLQEASATIVVLADAPIYKHGISLNKLYDFMAAARPVILVGEAFNNPVEDAGAGVPVSERSTRAISRAILALAELPYEELCARGLRGRSFVEDHHSIARLAERLEEEVLLPLSESRGRP